MAAGLYGLVLVAINLLALPLASDVAHRAASYDMGWHEASTFRAAQLSDRTPSTRSAPLLLTWNDKGCLDPYRARSRSTRKVNTTGWLRGLEVTAGGAGIVSHAGVALLRALADRTGLTGGLSRALASRPAAGA